MPARHASAPRAGFIRADHRAGADLSGDLGCGRRQRRAHLPHQRDQAPFADVQAEHVRTQRHQPRVGDMLFLVQVGRNRREPRPEPAVLGEARRVRSDRPVLAASAAHPHPLRFQDHRPPWGSSTTWRRPITAPPLAGNAAPHAPQASGRQTITASTCAAGARTRLVPRWPNLGPRFGAASAWCAVRLRLGAAVGGLEEFSGVLRGGFAAAARGSVRAAASRWATGSASSRAMRASRAAIRATTAG